MQKMSVEKAEIERDHLRAEIVRLEGLVASAKTKLSKIETYLEIARGYENPEEPSEGVRRRRGADLIPLVIAMLNQRKKPLKTAALLEELEEQGYTVGGTNKVTNLSSILSRSPELLADRTNGWSLLGWKDAPPFGLLSAAQDWESSLADDEKA